MSGTQEQRGDPGGRDAGGPPTAQVVIRDEPPPFWGRWRRIYWFVAGLLATDVLLMWLLTRWAS